MFRTILDLNPFAKLDDEENERRHAHFEPLPLPEGKLAGLNVAVIGGGVGGLTAAYEVLISRRVANVTVFEARDRVGGRVLTLRNDDELVEDKTADLYSTPDLDTKQKVHFTKPPNDEQEPYLNAGAGRIPSHHKYLLGFLHKFKLPLEVYVMESESNLAHIDDSKFKAEQIVNRRLLHNTRGRIAELVYHNAASLLNSSTILGTDDDDDDKSRTKYKAGDIKLLKDLMMHFGELDNDGYYGRDRETTRAGYVKLPGVYQGDLAAPFSLHSLLQSRFWDRTRVFQPDDFLWQPTMFQPVGGMDQVAKIFEENVKKEGGHIKLNTPVLSIRYDRRRPKGKYEVVYKEEGKEQRFFADYVFCNVAIPFLEKIVDESLQSVERADGFDKDFKRGLHAVYEAQRRPVETERFLAYTTKVGWYAKRDLWQGSWLEPWHVPVKPRRGDPAGKETTVGVVPIYGGISWTDHPIQQIWYPSSGVHDEMGILTGCYNFQDHAKDFGEMTPDERLNAAIEGAREFSDRFANGLKKENGVSIAWQKIPYIKGGWAQWQYVGDAKAKEKSGDHYADFYNALTQGTGVNGDKNPTFFIVGDQTSQLYGWQEGAVVSALNAISRIADPTRPVPLVRALGNFIASVQGGYTVNRDTMV